jgi:hypothetical protein
MRRVSTHRRSQHQQRCELRDEDQDAFVSRDASPSVNENSSSSGVRIRLIRSTIGKQRVTRADSSSSAADLVVQAVRRRW